MIIKIDGWFNSAYILSMIFIVAANCDYFTYFIDIMDGMDWFHYYFIVGLDGKVMMGYNNSYGG
jgi:hypothetical protein